MTIKKYLTTPEEILALKDTDTKIYKDNCCGYFKFVGGVFCYFSKTSDVFFNVELGFNQVESQLYIEVEELEVTKEDIGKLCWFWDFDEKKKQIGVLVELDEDSCPYRNGYGWYHHCRRLTNAEVAEITGYK